MKIATKSAVTVLVLGISTWMLAAQDGFPPAGNERRQPRQSQGGAPGGTGGPGMNSQHPPTPPIVNALDANRDGTLDANEIANASAALKTLDKNGDGKLTPEELRPARPQGQGPGGQGPGGQRPGGEGQSQRGPRGPGQ